MAHPLDSAYLKLNRAVEHLKALDEEVRAFANDEIERLREEGYDESTEGPLRPIWVGGPHHSPFPQQKGQVRRQLKPRFSVILGDYLSNLRASLDHAVNAIAGSRAGSHTKFPIVDHKTKWRDAAKSDLVGVPVPCKTAIRAMQPYHGHRRGKRLLLLATLCNADKHKIVHPTGLLLYQGVWTFPEGSKGGTKSFRSFGVLGDQTEVRITFTDPHSEPKVEGGVPYQIAFSERKSTKIIVMRVDLDVMLEEVRAVIDRMWEAATTD